LKIVQAKSTEGVRAGISLLEECCFPLDAIRILTVHP